MEAVKVRMQTQPGFANTLREGAPKLLAAEGIRGYVVMHGGGGGGGTGEGGWWGVYPGRVAVYNQMYEAGTIQKLKYTGTSTSGHLL